MSKSQIELRKLMFSSGATDDQIKDARKKLFSLHDQIDECNINDFLAIRKMLTPEQKQHLSELMPVQRPGMSTAPMKRSMHKAGNQLETLQDGRQGPPPATN